jgi:hypothetical protein
MSRLETKILSQTVGSQTIVAPLIEATPTKIAHRKIVRSKPAAAKLVVTKPVVGVAARSTVDRMDRGLTAPSADVGRVLLLHARDVRMEYRYVAGKPIFAGTPCPQKSGALIVGECKKAEKLQLGNIIDAILVAIDHQDPSAPPEQRARFQSLAMRFDMPNVPYWLRSVFLDIGQSPTVANATSRSVVLAASRFRVATEVTGQEYPTVREALVALRQKLATDPIPTQTPTTLRTWQR